MAIVTMPLMGLTARGQLGKAIVYFPWKGLDCVRSYVIPANPNTPDQQTQRGYFGDAVDEWHAAAYTVVDIAAWNRSASVATSPRSGFNVLVSNYIDVVRAIFLWGRLRNLVFAPGPASFVVTVESVADHTAKLRWGYSKTYMPTIVNGAWMLGEVTFTVPVAAANAYVFFQAYNASVGTKGNTGIGTGQVG